MASRSPWLRSVRWSALVVLVVAALARADHACSGLFPGARMTRPAGCTFNFVFEDQAGTKYIGSAGHCVSAVGQRVEASGLGEIGTVVFFVNEGEGRDFALIRVDAEDLAILSPTMCHWGGPTAAEPSPSIGDRVLQYGHGLVLGATSDTRPRDGALRTWTDQQWTAGVPVASGDSGSPAIFADGSAAGVVTHLSARFAGGGVSFAIGMRLPHAIALAEAGTGLELRLVAGA